MSFYQQQIGIGQLIQWELAVSYTHLLPGSAVYAIKVQGAIHEFSAIDGVVEDVTAMILNIKKLVFDVDSEDLSLIHILKELKLMFQDV